MIATAASGPRKTKTSGPRKARSPPSQAHPSPAPGPSQQELSPFIISHRVRRRDGQGARHLPAGHLPALSPPIACFPCCCHCRLLLILLWLLSCSSHSPSHRHSCPPDLLLFRPSLFTAGPPTVSRGRDVMTSTAACMMRTELRSQPRLGLLDKYKPTIPSHSWGSSKIFKIAFPFEF